MALNIVFPFLQCHKEPGPELTHLCVGRTRHIPIRVVGTVDGAVAVDILALTGQPRVQLLPLNDHLHYRISAQALEDFAGTRTISGTIFCGAEMLVSKFCQIWICEVGIVVRRPPPRHWAFPLPRISPFKFSAISSSITRKLTACPGRIISSHVNFFGRQSAFVIVNTHNCFRQGVCGLTVCSGRREERESLATGSTRCLNYVPLAGRADLDAVLENAPSAGRLIGSTRLRDAGNNVANRDIRIEPKIPKPTQLVARKPLVTRPLDLRRIFKKKEGTNRGHL